MKEDTNLAQIAVQGKLGALPDNHVDKASVATFESLLENLYMYSEAKYPYKVFLWDTDLHGVLHDEPYIFNYMEVVTKVHGEKRPILRSNLLQAKHKENFEFEGDKLKNKKPRKFYTTKYAALNRFMGRIYTDNGALNENETKAMRTFAEHALALELGSVHVFEFGKPVTQHYLMGKTEHGHWLGVHTVSVET